MRVKPATWFALSLLALIPAAWGPAAAAEAPRLELRKGDRVVLIGNTLAERMQHFGHFETLLHSRFPEHELVVRDLGWSADELALRPRSAGFEDHGHTLKDEKPDVVLAAFGFNESFGGPEGLDRFKTDLEAFLRETTTTAYNGKAPPRLVLLSPIAHEDLGDPHLPDGRENNANIRLYTAAMAELARAHGVAFVDLFAPTERMMREDERPLTINGIHLGDYGDARLAEVLDGALFGPRPAQVKADLQSCGPRSWRRTSSSGTTTARSTAATSTAAARPRSGSSTSRRSSPSSADDRPARPADLGGRPGRGCPRRRSTTAGRASSAGSRPTPRGRST
jgi:hypothetical protein